ncbi:MAG TPA: magnesium transporter CorA family protein [Actinomycetota bacterium]|nr:magnesium transporter CorA family protein [Actinomycetota bacterium]
MLMAICHSAEDGWSDVEDLTSVSDLRGTSGILLWAETDVSSLTADDVATIAEEFELHPLAVEDAIHARQRPKVEVYDTHLFVVFDQLDLVNDQLEAVQIACFVGERYVLTLHAGAARSIAIAKQRWARAQQELGQGPPYLLHTLLDSVVDDYQRIADDLELRVEELEELVLESPGAPVSRQLYAVKQKVSRLRRYALPVARVLEGVKTHPGTPSDALAHFGDVHDHVLRIADQVRNVDDLSQAVLDLTRAEQAYALNEVTKRLTGWAAVIAVPTFIASVYGMNFELMPESGQLFGFWFALSLMTVSAVGLYVFLKKREWI